MRQPLAIFVTACALLVSSAAPTLPPEYALLRNSLNMAAIRTLHPQPDGSFSFVVLGDNRDGEVTYRGLLEQVNAYTAAHSGSERPLFILHTGDSVANGTTAEWKRYADIRRVSMLPIVHVRGNHEVKAAGGASNFQRFVGNTQWAFDFAGCRFIGVDNAYSHFTPRGIEILRKYLGLSSTEGRPPVLAKPRRSFVVMHQPPFVGRWQVHALRSDEKGGRGNEMLRACTEADTTAVFCGHLHLHDEMAIEGVPYIISGGAGAPPYDKYGFGDVEHGFLLVQVMPAGASWKWVPRSP